MSEIIRKHYVFTGRVQGVGFRYKACKAADMLGITGWVRNEWNDSVTMEVQGTREALDRLMILLDSDRYIRIESSDWKIIRTAEDERRFVVKD